MAISVPVTKTLLCQIPLEVVIYQLLQHKHKIRDVVMEVFFISTFLLFLLLISFKSSTAITPCFTPVFFPFHFSAVSLLPLLMFLLRISCLICFCQLKPPPFLTISQLKPSHQLTISRHPPFSPSHISSHPSFSPSHNSKHLTNLPSQDISLSHHLTISHLKPFPFLTCT